MSDRLGNSMDLPFEEAPPGQTLDLSDAAISGGLVVMAATMPVPDVGTLPALVFRFATPTGQFYRPILLVLDEDQAAKLPQLVLASVAAAINRAKTA